MKFTSYGKKISLKVPGRICLMSNKVDLLGKPVIGMAINLMLTINYEEKNNNIVEFYSHNTKERKPFNLDESPPRNIDLVYWSVLFDRLKKYIKKGFYIEVISDIPIGAGLSTSAAISIGFIKAINQAYNLNLTTDDIAELAYLGENHDLRIMCGRLDQYTIAHGGIVFINTDSENPVVEYLNIEKMPIVVGDSLEARKAFIILNRIKKKIRQNDPATLEVFKIIERCVYQARDALLKKDFNKIGELMNKHLAQEAVLKTDTPKLLKLCKVAINAGVLGAKQIGAGGGGCIVAIAPEKQKEIAEAITKAGGRAWIFDIYRYYLILN